LAQDKLGDLCSLRVFAPFSTLPRSSPTGHTPRAMPGSFIPMLALLVLAGLIGEGSAGDHFLSTEDIQQTLLAELALSENGTLATRLIELEAALRPTYVALPKNEHGNLGHAAVRYVLHRFFIQRHGWFVKGLEPDGGAWANASTPTSMLRDRMPVYIQNIFEQRLGGKGFGLHEVSVLAATLEHLMHDEAIGRLRAAYEAHQLALTDRVDVKEADEIIETYMMSFINGVNLAEMTPDILSELRERTGRVYEGWGATLLWAQDVRLSVAYADQSRAKSLSAGQLTFSNAARVIEKIGDEYGRYQDLECRTLKDVLMELEEPDSGRVLLSNFYNAQLSGAVPTSFQFTESLDFLRQLGALDASDPKRLSVIIPNYVGARTNCLASSDFFTVCCIDECEALLGHIEREVSGPSAPPQELATLVARLPSDTVDAPRNLSAPLVGRLHEIASNHGGSVPLHGRLFAQWLHHAYPRECPYPHVTGEGSPLTADEWMAEELRTATEEDMVKHATHDRGLIRDEDGELPWHAGEELFVHHEASTLSSMLGTVNNLMPYAVLLSVALTLARTFRSSLIGVYRDTMKNGWKVPSFAGKKSSSDKYTV